MNAARAARAIAIGLALGLLVTQFGATLMRVTGHSMAPTLEESGILLVLRPPVLALADLVAPSRSPRQAERGAVVVLPEPRAAGAWFGLGRPLIVKRVVGLPGERVAMVGGELLVDGRPLPEPWLEDTYGGTTNMRPREVPGGTVFLLGDNRLPLASSDSRSFGPQPVTALRGRAVAELQLPWGEEGLRSPVRSLN